MLVFDQLKKNDAQLRVLTLVVILGFVILLVGLWWVQIVSSRQYQANLETQSFRTVRIPAVRGKILDRNGAPLAENRPTYNVGLYLDELRGEFDKVYREDVGQVTAQFNAQVDEEEKKLGRKLNKAERRAAAAILSKRKSQLRRQARYEVGSNVVQQVSQRLRQPLSLNVTNFERHYEKSLALPFPIVTNLNPAQIALFEEQSSGQVGVDIEVQSMRSYPHGTTAAHLLGQLRRDDSSRANEDAYFSFRLPDYKGVVGIEYGYDEQLRGVAGAKSVLVNSLGYRQTENIWSEAKAGENVVLTLDLGVQQVAERALQNANGPGTRGAAVVMDVRTGDILAMASTPTYDPNWFVPNLSKAEMDRLVESRAEKNRATQENYMPGSIFKLVVAMAALEAGWDPKAIINVQENPNERGKGYIKIGNHVIKDTVAPGDYDFKLAIKRSSNTYFVRCATNVGPERIIRLGNLLHLGERTGFAKTAQEVPGAFPNVSRLDSGWGTSKTANLSIGQDPTWVTPLQMAVMTAAIANGGKVLKPRLVDRVEPADPFSRTPPDVKPSGVIRENLGLSDRTFSIVHDAMLAETEDADGTGKHVRDHVSLTGLRICGKTGTAQVQNERNTTIGYTVWFASFAPFCPPDSNEKPRYAVVVMVENVKSEPRVSGGTTCAPVAGLIYQALMDRERTTHTNVGTMARSN